MKITDKRLVNALKVALVYPRLGRGRPVGNLPMRSFKRTRNVRAAYDSIKLASKGFDGAFEELTPFPLQSITEEGVRFFLRDIGRRHLEQKVFEEEPKEEVNYKKIYREKVLGKFSDEDYATFRNSTNMTAIEFFRNYRAIMRKPNQRRTAIHPFESREWRERLILKPVETKPILQDLLKTELVSPELQKIIYMLNSQ